MNTMTVKDVAHLAVKRVPATHHAVKDDVEPVSSFGISDMGLLRTSARSQAPGRHLGWRRGRRRSGLLPGGFGQYPEETSGGIDGMLGDLQGIFDASVAGIPVWALLLAGAVLVYPGGKKLGLHKLPLVGGVFK